MAQYQRLDEQIAACYSSVQLKPSVAELASVLRAIS
jgi:hypothetical protein